VSTRTIYAERFQPSERKLRANWTLSMMSERSRHMPKNSEFPKSPNVRAFICSAVETTSTISAGPTGTSVGSVMRSSRFGGMSAVTLTVLTIDRRKGLIESVHRVGDICQSSLHTATSRQSVELLYSCCTLSKTSCLFASYGLTDETIVRIRDLLAISLGRLAYRCSPTLSLGLPQARLSQTQRSRARGVRASSPSCQDS